jgi:formylglycine-generating enzyme required for sulfatase activity
MRRVAALAITIAALLACRGDAIDRAPDRAPAPDARAAAPVDAMTAGAIAVAAPPGPYDGPDCSASYAPRPDRDPSPMCFAPGGTFQMGAPDGDDRGNAESRPRHAVTLSPYFIDQHEVTGEQFLRFLESPEARPRLCEEIIPGVCLAIDNRDYLPYAIEPARKHVTSASMRLVPLPDFERHPVVLVSFAGAQAYCAWAGKALPSEAQWECAAAHDPITGADRAFPWGDRFEPERVRCSCRWRLHHHRGAVPTALRLLLAICGGPARPAIL